MEVQETAAIGGDGLVVTRAKAERVAELIVTSTEPLGRGQALEPAHTSDPAFEAAVALFKAVVLVRAVAMLDASAQR